MSLALDAADEDKVNQFTGIVRHRALIRPILARTSLPLGRAAFVWYGTTGTDYRSNTSVRAKVLDSFRLMPTASYSE